MSNSQSEIVDLIKKHSFMMNSIKSSTIKILRSAEASDLESVLEHTENRERTISVLKYLQEKMETVIEDLDKSEITKEVVETLGNWKKDFENNSLTISKIDQNILDLLSKNKSEISKEIALIFSNKSKFKGYDLNNLK